MKKVIRSEVFESASSSVSNLVILTEEENKKWMNNGYVYIGYSGWEWRDLEEQPKKNKWYSKEEVEEWVKKVDTDYDPDDSDNEVIFRDHDFISSDGFFENEYLETSETEYTTPSGEKIVISQQYGYDG